MNNTAHNRLIKELKSYNNNNNNNNFKNNKNNHDKQSKNNSNSIQLNIINDDLFHWKGVISGPIDTPYYGYDFILDIIIPSEYPLVPPKVKFITPIFHPNIHFETGEICLDIIKQSWLPIHTLESVCLSIYCLLSSPEPSSPLNCDCGNLFRCGDLRGYRSLAKMYASKFADENQ